MVSNDDYSEMLSIDKHNLNHMKIEFKKEFHEFIKGGVEELEKTISIRIHYMEKCHAIMHACIVGTPKYTLETLTNKQVADMSSDQII